MRTVPSNNNGKINSLTITSLVIFVVCVFSCFFLVAQGFSSLLYISFLFGIIFGVSDYFVLLKKTKKVVSDDGITISAGKHPQLLGWIEILVFVSASFYFVVEFKHLSGAESFLIAGITSFTMCLFCGIVTFVFLRYFAPVTHDLRTRSNQN